MSVGLPRHANQLMLKCTRRWRETYASICRSAPTVGTRVTVTIAPFKEKPRFRPLPDQRHDCPGAPRATVESAQAIVAAADLYRDIPGYRLTHRPRRLRFSHVSHGRHCRSSHRHVRGLVHGRRGGTRQRVMAAFSGCALGPTPASPGQVPACPRARRVQPQRSAGRVRFPGSKFQRRAPCARGSNVGLRR